MVFLRREFHLEALVLLRTRALADRSHGVGLTLSRLSRRVNGYGSTSDAYTGAKTKAMSLNTSSTQWRDDDREVVSEEEESAHSQSMKRLQMLVVGGC